MEEHRVDAAVDINETMIWLMARGFIGAIVANEGTHAGPVLLVGMPGYTPIMATVGNTLVWDGEALTVRS